MATAKKCDRCGALYEEKWLEPAPYRYKVEKQCVPDYYSHHLDLCDKCYAKLKHFLEEEVEQC